MRTHCCGVRRSFVVFLHSPWFVHIASFKELTFISGKYLKGMMWNTETVYNFIVWAVVWPIQHSMGRRSCFDGFLFIIWKSDFLQQKSKCQGGRQKSKELLRKEGDREVQGSSRLESICFLSCHCRASTQVSFVCLLKSIVIVTTWFEFTMYKWLVSTLLGLFLPESSKFETYFWCGLREFHISGHDRNSLSCGMMGSRKQCGTLWRKKMSETLQGTHTCKHIQALWGDTPQITVIEACYQ